MSWNRWYEDVNDAERLAHDPATRAVVDRTGLDRQAASTSQIGRFETGWLTSEANLAAPADLSGIWIDRLHARRLPATIVLDMDSSVSETHGTQEGPAYNGHFGCACYHPLFVFNQLGDLERCSLRSGNVHSAAKARCAGAGGSAYRHTTKRRYFRGDAAYTGLAIHGFPENEGYKYTIRLPANAVLQERFGWLLKRPAGRSPHAVRRPYADFTHQAASWNKPRRVVAKVEWYPGELYPRVGFIVPNMTRPPEPVTLFYNQRDSAEQHTKEGKNAVTWTRLSCHQFAANAVRLQPHALA
jgi:Transposase DDE domain group 1